MISAQIKGRLKELTERISAIEKRQKGLLETFELIKKEMEKENV